MHLEKVINVIHAHAEGEVGWVITGGLPEFPGETILEKQTWLRENDFAPIKHLMQQPRSNDYVSLNLILPTADPSCDFGLITVETDHCPPISGSNTICSVTVALETGIVPMTEPETKVRIETPLGVVETNAFCENKKCVNVEVVGIDCFVYQRGIKISTPSDRIHHGDIVFSGAFFVAVEISHLDLTIHKSFEERFVALGKEIYNNVKDRILVQHPTIPEINEIGFVLFYDNSELQDTMPGAIFIPPNRMDQSPCGTGTMSRLALLSDRGRISVGQSITQISMLGTVFTARILAEKKIGEFEGITASIRGRAWITGVSEFCIAPTDPFPQGF